MAVTQTSASPSSSPRLPSPPPLTEVQFGPRSPSLSGDNINNATTTITDGEIDLGGSNPNDATHTRRIRPGSKAEEMSAGPPLVPLSDLDSAFQLQEHLQALYLSHTHPSNSTHTVPITRSTAQELASPPDGIDRSLWLYELVRLLTRQLNIIIVAFFTDDPPCSSATCPEMRASEWQYLCAVHDPPKPCCAIDYSCHTLDWAANMLTSSKHFPSRLSLGSSGVSSSTAMANGTEGGLVGQQQQGMRNLTNICRRLYRIFAHAWYQHRSVFWQVETQTGLYVFFKTVCDLYQLIPEDNYTIPVEAEGVVDGDSRGRSNHGMEGAGGGGPRGNPTQFGGPTILRKQSGDHPGMFTTRRHMTSLSVGSLSRDTTTVATVPEEGENEGGENAKREDYGEGKEGEDEEEGSEVKRPKTRRTVEENEQEGFQQQSQEDGQAEINEGGRDRSPTLIKDKSDIDKSIDKSGAGKAEGEAAEPEKMDEKQQDGRKDDGEGKEIDTDNRPNDTIGKSSEEGLESRDEKTGNAAAAEESPTASDNNLTTTDQQDDQPPKSESIDADSTLESSSTPASANPTDTESKPTQVPTPAVDPPRREDEHEAKVDTDEPKDGRQRKDNDSTAIESDLKSEPAPSVQKEQPIERREQAKEEGKDGSRQSDPPSSQAEAVADASPSTAALNQPHNDDDEQSRKEGLSNDNSEGTGSNIAGNSTAVNRESQPSSEERKGKPEEDKQQEGPEAIQEATQSQKADEARNEKQDAEDEEEGGDDEHKEEEGDEEEGQEAGAGAILVQNDNGKEIEKMDGIMKDAGVL